MSGPTTRVALVIPRGGPPRLDGLVRTLLDGRRASPANPGPARADRDPGHRLRLRLELGLGSGSPPSADAASRLGVDLGSFEVRPVFARYSPGVQFGPRSPRTWSDQMSHQPCPMKPTTVQGMLMECDADKTVYLMKDPITTGGVDSAVAKQIGHSKTGSSRSPSTRRRPARSPRPGRSLDRHRPRLLVPGQRPDRRSSSTRRSTAASSRSSATTTRRRPPRLAHRAREPPDASAADLVGVAPLALERQPPGERRDQLVDLVGTPRAL